MAQQDEVALRLLYDRWASLVYAVAVKIVNHADAEEVLEDTFWQAWRRAEEYSPSRGKVSTWLTMIARSRALDRKRRQKRSRLEEWQTDAERTPHSGSSPLMNSVDSDRRHRIDEAIERLPEAQKETVRLAYYEGLSQSQIAERLGKPLGTIKTRARLAGDKLKSYLRVLSDADP